MTNTLYLPELREMLAENNVDEMREFCTALHPAEVAEFMEGLSAEESWAVIHNADLPTRVQIFGYFDRAKQIETLTRGDRAEMGRFIGDLPPDDRVDLLNQLDPAVVEELMPLVPAIERRDIRRLQSYPENTAGAVMTTEYARLSPNLNARQALEELGRQSAALETIYYLYILDDREHLEGVVSTRQLVSALGKPNVLVGDLTEHEVVTVNVTEDQEEVARKVARYDLLAIPVVDDEHHMLGIVTHDDVIDIMVEEATEEAHRMAGMIPMEEDYLEANFVSVWRKRAGWLCLLFVAELFTFTALASYENAIEKVVALALFVPLCISTGGNSGSQAATLVTRALALEQVRIRDWLRVLRHEILMGLALGVTLGAIGFVRAALTPQSVLGGVNPWDLALVVAQAVALICIWGTIVGAMLPLLFRRAGIDPGYASSPFVATFVDVTGIVIYFSIAQTYLLPAR